jgi:hypothetical protein
MKKLLNGLLLFIITTSVHAQGLENIIVETYYISSPGDATDTIGGNLPAGSTTYRIYADMLPGYKLKAIYGSPDHLLRLATTTSFFNNKDRGTQTGDAINFNKLNENTLALDSWLTIGIAAKLHLGVLKAEDPDGSQVGGVHNDGGSAAISGGLLVNADGNAGIPLTTSDGLVAGATPAITTLGFDLAAFENNTTTAFTATNGIIFCLEGIKGPTNANQVLLAQLTTNGTLTFELNLQLESPDGVTEYYVARNPKDGELPLSQLTR